MKLWLDNTGIHSVGACFDGSARGDFDIKGLLQFATYMVFCDKLYINGFEASFIAERTFDIVDKLYSKGFDKSSLIIIPHNESTYGEACKAAANEAADDLRIAFNPKENELLGLQPLDIPERVMAAQASFIELANDKLDPQRLYEVRKTALLEKAVGAVGFMLASSPDLRKEIRSMISSAKRWSNADSHQLNGFLRYYLNDSLARMKGANHAPAVARAQLLRDRNLYIVEQVSRSIDNCSKRLRSLPLGLPSVSTTLIAKSKGDPIGVIREAIALREKMNEARLWITKKIGRLNSDDPEDLFEIDKIIKDVFHMVEMDLGLTKAPKFRDAIEILFVLGVPVPRLSGSKIYDWVEYRWKKRKINILSGISKASAFTKNQSTYYKELELKCFSK